MRIEAIPTSLEALENWAKEYEEKNMVFAETNKKVADETVRMLLFHVPHFAHGVARMVVGESTVSPKLSQDFSLTLFRSF